MRKYANERYLKSEDLLSGGKYRKLSIEIDDVVTGCPLMRKGGIIEANGLAFAGKDKIFGLNITNQGILQTIAGDANPEKWVGIKIDMEVRLVRNAQGGEEPAIRIMPGDVPVRYGLKRMLGKEIE